MGNPATVPTDAMPPAASEGGRAISLIVIHCAATPNGRWHDVWDIDLWHKRAGFQRAMGFRKRQNPELEAIGYHFVVYTSGAVATGRHLDEAGAHAVGYNRDSIGICLVGTDQFLLEQWKALAACVGALVKRYNVPAAFAPVRANGRRMGGICGHRDLPGVRKGCPGFSIERWLAGGMAPLGPHVLTPDAPEGPQEPRA